MGEGPTYGKLDAAGSRVFAAGLPTQMFHDYSIRAAFAALENA